MSWWHTHQLIARKFLWSTMKSFSFNHDPYDKMTYWIIIKIDLSDLNSIFNWKYFNLIAWIHNSFQPLNLDHQFWTYLFFDQMAFDFWVITKIKTRGMVADDSLTFKSLMQEHLNCSIHAVPKTYKPFRQRKTKL